MSVTTGTTFTIFFLVVFPGLIYEGVRQLRRPSRNDSAFVELGRILIAGSVVGMLSFLLLWGLNEATAESLGSVSGALTGTDYFGNHVQQLLLAGLLYLVVTFGFALVVAQVGSKAPYGHISSQSAWTSAIRRRPSTGVPQVWLVLEDGNEVVGVLSEMSTAQSLENREVSLGPPFSWVNKEGKARDVTGFDRLIFSGDTIQAFGLRWIKDPIGQAPSKAKMRALLRWGTSTVGGIIIGLGVELFVIIAFLIVASVTK